MSAALERLADRVKADPWFLAHSLAEYACSAGLDDNGLAAKLGCAVVDLSALRLCRAPRPDADGFRADLEAVAERFRLNLAALVAAVRHGESLARLRAAPTENTDAGWQIAARDRDTPG